MIFKITKLSSCQIFRQFSIFTIYGLISNIISFLLYYIFLKILNFEYIFSYLISNLLIITISFFVYSKVFKSISNFNNMKKYIFTQLIFSFSHILLIILMVEKLSYDKAYSHILSNILLACIIFFVYKFLVFKK